MLKSRLSQNNSDFSVNMTPVVDIVFLLIIFFMLVCQFIIAENFEVPIPTDTKNALGKHLQNEKITTVTVLGSDFEMLTCAVGSEIISYENTSEMIEKITNAIDAQLKPIKDEKKIVRLRMNKDIPYSQSQHILSAIANSVATSIQLSTINSQTDRDF